MKKRLWIDPALVQEAIDSKEALDALALCCMVKLTFADSMVKDATVRRLMALFHLSHGRCVKAVEAGIARGYFFRDGNHLRACKVRSERQNNVPLDISVDGVAGECPVGIAKMRDLLRGAVLYNHIAKQNDLRDTIRIARDPEEGELRAMRKARARLRKKGVCVDSVSADEVVRLSYASVCALLNVSRTKAIALVKTLRESGLVKRILQYEETGLELGQFSKAIQKGYARHGSRGFMVLIDGMVCLQLANAYLLQGDSLVKFLY